MSIAAEVWLMRALWIALGAVWLLGAIGADRTVRRPPGAYYRPHLAIMAFGVALMVNAFDWIKPLDARLWSSRYAFPPGLLLLACGVALAIWARIHLGRYWSAAVGSKAEHRLIESGPYARLRHPIYTGISLGVLGSALADGTVHALLGAAILIAAMVAKGRREEEWLSREFGASYAAYRRRSWSLLPFIY